MGTALGPRSGRWPTSCAGESNIGRESEAESGCQAEAGCESEGMSALGLRYWKVAQHPVQVRMMVRVRTGVERDCKQSELK